MRSKLVVCGGGHGRLSFSCRLTWEWNDASVDAMDFWPLFLALPAPRTLRPLKRATKRCPRMRSNMLRSSRLLLSKRFAGSRRSRTASPQLMLLRASSPIALRASRSSTRRSYRIVVLLTGSGAGHRSDRSGCPVVFRTGAKATRAEAVAAMRRHLIDFRTELPGARGAGYDQRTGEVVLLVSPADASRLGVDAIRARAEQISGVPVRVVVNELRSRPT